MDIGFKDFLLNENKAYLSQRAGNILTALQDIDQNSQGMGTKQLVKSAEGVANQIRRILHTHWSKGQEHNLKKLQKVAVALLRSVEEKSDLEPTIKSSIQELEGMLGNMDAPVNQLATPEGGLDPSKGNPQSGVGDSVQPPPEPPAPQDDKLTPAPAGPAPAGGAAPAPTPAPPAGA